MEWQHYPAEEILGDMNFIERAELREIYCRQNPPPNYMSNNRMLATGKNNIHHLFEHFIEASPSAEKNMIMLTFRTCKEDSYRLIKMVSNTIIFKKL